MIDEINNQVDKLVADSRIQSLKYLNCHARFINTENGTISEEDFWDFLHLTDIGYEKLCTPLLAYLKSISILSRD